MAKKDKGWVTAPSSAQGEKLAGLVRQALESQHDGEGFAPLLEEVNSLSPIDISRFATSLAHEGQERAIPVLEALAGVDRVAPAAVESLGSIKSQEAAGFLLQVRANSPDKELRKAASRALYRLRNLGVTIDEPAEAPTEPATPASPQQPESHAWASSVDGAGSRFMFFSVPEPLGGHRNFVFLMINDADGIKEARVGHIESNDDAEARVDRVSRESGLPHIELPIDYARHLVKEGRERTQAAGRPLPTEYMVWKEAIREPKEPWERPPVYQELNSAQILMEPGLLEESARLLDLKEFRGWRLETEQMRPYAEELEHAKMGTIVLPEAAQAEREERLLEKAMDDLLRDQGRPRYRRRLEEMSYLLLHTGREREAKAALAAALAVEQESRKSSLYLPGSRATDLMLGDRSPLANHPFFRRLLIESINLALERISRGRKLLVAG